MKLLFIAIIFIAFLGTLSCKKDVIEPVLETECNQETELLVADSTYGDYHISAVIYVDSVGMETNYYPTTMTLTITSGDIDILQSGVTVEHYDYTTIFITNNTNYYDIQSQYGPPCNEYSITYSAYNMYYITLPTNNVGCYRVLKAFKL